ncbi:MAG: hypothetical protein II222_01655 [Paraprevotella sp.]|nr:hypothetical protein [Paraprevotella sp.]
MKINKRIFSGSLCAVIAVLLLASCEEEKHISHVPTFEGFQVYVVKDKKLTVDKPSSGDSIVVEAVQSQLGSLLYKAIYKWGIVFRPQGADAVLDTTITKKVVYDSNPVNPRVGLRLPNVGPGYASVSFEAEYSYSATGEMVSSGGNYNDPNTGRYGQITMVNSSQLYGVCRGRASVTVYP